MIDESEIIIFIMLWGRISTPANPPTNHYFNAFKSKSIDDQLSEI